jgi:hypothetical protein
MGNIIEACEYQEQMNYWTGRLRACIQAKDDAGRCIASYRVQQFQKLMYMAIDSSEVRIA